jgi:hypothetical protein
MKMLVGQFRREARRFSVPHHAAITAQQSCSINDDESLVGRDGYEHDRDTEEEVCRVGNLANAKTFPPRHAGANAKWGFIHPRQEQKGDG